MNPTPPEPRASLLSELLLYHAVLGRGYISPFPTTRGMVFTSSLPPAALDNMSDVEILFHRYHEQAIDADRKALAQAEDQPEHMLNATGMTKAKIKEMKDRISKRAHILWKEEQTQKPTIVELLKNHYYGAYTYLDPFGSKLAGALSQPWKLASDLGWKSLVGRTTEETFIRSGNTGGALIHSLTGVNPVFNYFCSCEEGHLEKLIEKVKSTSQGLVGVGTTIAIRGRPGIFSGTTAETLYSLAQRVFALGDKPEEKRVRVRFAPGLDREWQTFLNWQLPQLINEPDPPAWQVKLSHTAPTSPENAVLFAARAAMVSAFIQVAEANPDGMLREIELDDRHLDVAKAMAKHLYRTSSGQEGFEKRIKNLKDPKEVFTTPHKLSIAQTALMEFIEKAPARRLSRDFARREIPGVTLGLLDELVKQGKIVELCGVEECQMGGRTTRAYTLPKYAPPGNVEDALGEYEEALADFAAHPEAFRDSEALAIARSLCAKAVDIHSVHFLPVVSLSRMDKNERRMLPKVMSMFPDSFLLRGDATSLPEPKILSDDDDVPFDAGGANLWVRHRPNGADFCDWKKAHTLKLAEYWTEENAVPHVVPA